MTVIESMGFNSKLKHYKRIFRFEKSEPNHTRDITVVETVTGF